LSGAPRSAGRLVRRIVAAIILVPIAVIIIAFAVANRQHVTVLLDPFNPERPAASFTVPLFMLVIAILISGVVIGGSATWLSHGRWRRAARRFEREVHELRSELGASRRPAGGAAASDAAKPPERLQLRPPVQ
jgi:uncharacterized integral membrane protein